MGKVVANKISLSGAAVISFMPVSISDEFYWDPYLSS
jgi:hypothetical protein